MSAMDVVWKGVGEGFIALILYGAMWTTWYIPKSMIKDKTYPWWMFIFFGALVFCVIYALAPGGESAHPQAGLFHMVKYSVVGAVLMVLGILSGLGELGVIIKWHSRITG